MTTMNALRAHTRGGPEVLVYESAPVPDPGPGEVLIQVHAAAITFDELTWDETWSRDGHDRTPVIVSHEFSGVVASLGSGVVGIEVGAEVYGLVPFDRDGAAAEYVVTPADHVGPRPHSIDHVASAAVPLAALTAWQALVDHAAVQSGERVLVLGAAGGVGAFTTQLAVSLGADVTAVVREDAVDTVRGFGATVSVGSSAAAIGAAGSFDVVIDTVGGALLAESFSLVRSGGRLVTLTAPLPDDVASTYGIDASFFIVGADQSELAHVTALIDQNQVQVAVAATYSLADGRAAFSSRHDRGRRPGKVVLVVRA